jgi:hypothetical protein
MPRLHVIIILIFALIAVCAEGLKLYTQLDYGWRIAELERRLDAMPTFTPCYDGNAWEISLPKDRK